MRDNKGFYERYKEEQKIREKEEQFREKYNIGDDKTVVIKNETAVDKSFFYIGNIVSIIIKTIIYISIFLLSSIGATVIMNESLRNTFFILLQNVF